MCSSYRHGAVVDLDGREENGLGDFDWRIFFFQIYTAPPPSGLSATFLRVTLINGGYFSYT